MATWTKSEEACLRAHYPDTERIVKRVKRPIGAIYQKARHLGLTGTKPPNWTAEEDDYIRQHYQPLNPKPIAKALNRSVEALQRRARKLGLKITKRPWTEIELDYLRANYQSGKAKLCAAVLLRTEDTVRIRAGMLGLTKTQLPITDEDKAVIKKLNKKGMTDYEIARQMGRDNTTISKVRKRMKLPSRYVGQKQQELNAIGGRTRIQKRQAIAIQCGLPPDTSLRQIMVIMALLKEGTLQAREMLEKLGMRSLHNFHIYVMHSLIVKGLVTRVRLGQSVIYSLTPLSLDLLAKGTTQDV